MVNRVECLVLIEYHQGRRDQETMAAREYVRMGQPERSMERKRIATYHQEREDFWRLELHSAPGVML